MRIGGSRSRGFTLTEILVVLAILVILFALLFAPMMAGLDWVASGKATVGLQDACRFAMEQVRRELGDAVYVYPAPGVDIGSTRVINYSEVKFHPPHRNAVGAVVYPIQAEFADLTATAIGKRLPVVVRYSVQIADPSLGGSMNDARSFALYRQEYLRRDYPGGGWELGSWDSASGWQPGVAMSENAITPKTGATFIPSRTVLTDGGSPAAYSIVDGYAPNGVGSDTPLMYLFEGVQFVPERVCSEELISADGVLYEARHAAWDGLDPGQLGYSILPNLVSINRSELDPKVSLYRWTWNSMASAYDWAARTDMDNRVSTVRSVALNWSAQKGSVTCGQTAYRGMVFTTADPGVGWYGVAGSGDITPIRPSNAANPQDTANAPITYRIDPAQTVNPAAPAVIVPGSVKVRVVGTIVSGGTTDQRVYELKPTTNYDQTGMKGDEFCVQLVPRQYAAGVGDSIGTYAEVRLSRFDPPRPTSWALFGNTPPVFTTFELQIEYYLRRNYGYDANRATAGDDPFVNDLVRVDYSTRAIQNVSIALRRFTDLEPDITGAIFQTPMDDNPNEVRVREQVAVRNLGG